MTIVEDADRLNDQANNALLKAIEEPVERTVWVLCAPNVDDVLPTVRSRSRTVRLATPSAEDVADFLVRRHDVPIALAAHAARASQGRAPFAHAQRPRRRCPTRECAPLCVPVLVEALRTSRRGRKVAQGQPSKSTHSSRVGETM